MIKVLLVDGVFELLGNYIIHDPNDDFIRNCTTEYMMDQAMLVLEPGDKRAALAKAREDYLDQIKSRCVPGLGPIWTSVVPIDQFEKSAPGFIYLQSTISDLRAFDPAARIMLLLRYPGDDMYLDITLNPHAFGYGMELPESDAGETAWLAVEPGICNPARVEPVAYNTREYLHSITHM